MSVRRAGLGCVVLVCAGCASDLPPSPGTLEPPRVTAVQLLDSLDRAAKLALLPDGRMMFTEQRAGRIRVIDRDGRLLERPFFDVAVNGLRERGALGLAVDPNFPQRPYVYFFFVPSKSGRDEEEDKEDVDSVRVMRLEASGDVAGDSATILRLTSRPGPYHNAGNVIFGPDGKMYISLGELNRNANLHAQLHGGGNLRGKILRYNPDGSIPEDNPLGPGNAIYLYGMRNPYDFTFGSGPDELYISENGPAGHDEVHFARPKENLGWPLIWGFADRWYEKIARAIIGANYRRPIWESFQERVAPTGIEVLRTDLYGPELRGRVLFGQVNTGRVHQLAVDSEREIATGFGLFVEGLPLITDLAQDPDGRIYVLTLNALYRIDPTP